MVLISYSLPPHHHPLSLFSNTLSFILLFQSFSHRTLPFCLSSAGSMSKAPTTLSGWSSVVSTSMRIQRRWLSTSQMCALSTKMNSWAVLKDLSLRHWLTGRRPSIKTHTYTCSHKVRIQMVNMLNNRHIYWTDIGSLIRYWYDIDIFKILGNNPHSCLAWLLPNASLYFSVFLWKLY